MRFSGSQALTGSLCPLSKTPGIEPGAMDNFAIRLACEHGHAGVLKLLLDDPRIDLARLRRQRYGRTESSDLIEDRSLSELFNAIGFLLQMCQEQRYHRAASRVSHTVRSMTTCPLHDVHKAPLFSVERITIAVSRRRQCSFEPSVTSVDS